MPVPRDQVGELKPLAFRDPVDVLDPAKLYTVYEVARLLQGLDAEAEIDRQTEDILLDWAIPWMLYNADSLVFAEPESDTEPGRYGLATD